MPSKIRPDDWDRFFSANGPRQSGPLGILLKTVLVLGVAGGLAYGLIWFNTSIQNQNAARAESATATAMIVGPTQTAQAFLAAQQATAQAVPPSVDLPTGRVLLQAPLRAEPSSAAVSSGDLYPNSVVQFIESRDADGAPWWRVRVVAQANPQGAPEGSEGWVEAAALTAPAAPAPATPGTGASAPSVTLVATELQSYRDPQTGITLAFAPGWNVQPLPTLERSLLLAPTLDASSGAIAAKVIDQPQTADGFSAAVRQVAQAIAKPDTDVAIEADLNNQQMSGVVTLTRLSDGQDVVIKGVFEAQPAPGGSIGVVIAFVPQGSFAANEQVLRQITQTVIVQ